MARIRFLKPGFFLNPDLAKLPPLYRIVFQGLWCEADFKGCLEYRPERLKICIIPYDSEPIENAIHALCKAGFVRLYTGSAPGSNRVFLKVLNFEKHQHPHKKERDSGSEIPDMPTDYIDSGFEPGLDPEIPGFDPTQHGASRAVTDAVTDAVACAVATPSDGNTASCISENKKNTASEESTSATEAQVKHLHMQIEKSSAPGLKPLGPSLGKVLQRLEARRASETPTSGADTSKPLPHSGGGDLPTGDDLASRGGIQ